MIHSDRACEPKDLFLEQARGYVKVLEKSTYPLSTMKEVIEHCMQTGLARDLSCGPKTVVEQSDFPLALPGSLPPLPRRYWLRIRPQSLLSFSCFLLQPFQHRIS